MKSSKIFAAVAVALLNVVLCTVAVGQDKATAQEVVAKVREAAGTLSKTGDWPKPGEKEGSRKLAYGLSAKEPRMWWPPGSMTTRQPSQNCQS